MQNKIKITNKSHRKVAVAINVWDNKRDLSTAYFELGEGASDNWCRADSRGYIMSLADNGSVYPYFVHTGDEIEIMEDAVYENNNLIKPLNKAMNCKFEDLEFQVK